MNKSAGNGGQTGAVLSRIAMIVVVLLLAACASRPGADALRASAGVSPPGSRIVTVFLATSRQRVTPNQNVFSNAVDEGMNFAIFRVSVPPGHKPGQIELPGGKADPAKSFTVVDQEVLDRASFQKAVAAASHGQRGNVSIFVHGYNTNLPEAIFRQAQLSADSGMDAGAAIVFSWPSTGAVSGYIADKSAATASRDQLVNLISMAAGEAGPGDVAVAGHSMGGWLVAESLRQLRLTKRNDVLNHIKVVLAAPDIDVQVFRSQIDAIGKLKQPLVILVSRDDIALTVSSFISDDTPRIGQLDVDNPEIQAAARDANIQIIDISGVKSDDSFKHNRFATLAAYYPALRQQTAKGGEPNIARAGVFIFDAVGKTLTAPLWLGQRLAAGG